MRARQSPDPEEAKRNQITSGTPVSAEPMSLHTPETAAEMPNGLDRTLPMIDRLEWSTREEHPTAMSDALRGEVSQLHGVLQLQDIIAQQLRGAAAMLAEVEQRVAVTTLFDDQAMPDEVFQAGRLVPAPARHTVTG